MTSDATLANAVAGQDPVRVTGTWKRHLEARFRDRATEGRVAFTRWGRDPGFPILYLGSPIASVVVEAYRHLIDPVENPEIVEHLAPRVMITAEVDVDEILDLRTAGARMAIGLSLEQLHSPTYDRAAYEACREVAAAAHQQGFRGIIAPAATRLGETLAVFSARLNVTQVPQVIAEEYWERLPEDPRSEKRPRLTLVTDDD
jgi:RES domain-containing protein